ncbi:hypothetical protein, partial [Lutimonas sp.]|uniref:hypothetical protein n=1 Tax=Lutimonas sp. TaxID=1872403 RepID=UPI003C7860ED
MGSILPCCLPCGKAGGLQILSRLGGIKGLRWEITASPLTPGLFMSIIIFHAFPRSEGKNIYKITLVTENVTLSDP